MKNYRLTPCDCGESQYRLLPRRWWMRAWPGRRRYQCKSCSATLLLPRAGDKRIRKHSVLLVVVAALVAAWVSFYIVGYREDWSYNASKRAAENQ